MDLEKTIETEAKDTNGCDSCTYLTFDAIIKDQTRALIPELNPDNFPMESVYGDVLRSIMRKVTPETHGIVGIYDTENGYHIIVDLHNNDFTMKLNSDAKGCDTITEMKSSMDKVAERYQENNVQVKQFLITDNYAPCCEVKANAANNLHDVETLYRK